MPPLKTSRFPADTKIYLYGGEAESQYMIPTLNRLKANLQCAIEDDCAYLEIAVDPDGKHEEWRWSREFGKAVAWLFFKGVVSI